MGPRRGPARLVVVAVVAVVLLLPPPGRANFPVLPLADSGEFVHSLSAPPTAPGTSESVSGALRDPLPGTLLSVNLTVELYAFNAYPGNATGPIPSGASPTFEAPTGAGSADWFDIPSLISGATYEFQAPIVVPSAASAGTYAIRLHLIFEENGSTYVLASRGYFTYAAWTNATAGPNGTTGLNLSALDVSGILPETALLVSSNPFPWVIAGLLVGAAVLAVAGGYYLARSRPGSTSGARKPRSESAPRAFGKSDSRDGD